MGSVALEASMLPILWSHSPNVAEVKALAAAIRSDGKARVRMQAHRKILQNTKPQLKSTTTLRPRLQPCPKCRDVTTFEALAKSAQDEKV